MRPQQVLHEQAALIDFVGATPYKKYLDGFFADMQRTGKIGQHPEKINGVKMPWGEYIADILANGLKVSQAYHVTADMMPVLRSAAHDLDDLDYLVHERLPAEAGFMVFDGAWISNDVWGTQMTANALHWRHGSGSLAEFSDDRNVPGIWVFLFTDINDPRDEKTQELVAQHGWEALRNCGKLHLSHFFFLPYERRVGPTENLTDEEYARFALAADMKVAKSTTNHNRLIVALFRLLNQVLVEVRDEPLSRHEKKLAVRKNIPARVQTIKLRRKEILRPLGDSEPGTVEWQHKWIVRGHWPWRKCGEHHPYAEPYEKGWRCKVYVAPYWKGPEDAPVLITEKIWNLAQ